MSSANGLGSPSSRSSTDTRLAERRRRGTARIRITRACDRCKKRKIRCTGLQPCNLCTLADAPCSYNASYSRGRKGAAGAGLLRQSVVTGNASAEVDPPPSASRTSEPRGEPGVARAADKDAPGSSMTIAGGTPTPADSPEPTQTDLEGHYVGPASGLSFLIRVQKRLHETTPASSASSIFTFGDVSLPYLDPAGDSTLSYFDSTFFVMLSKEKSTQLVERYFAFTVPLDRFLHRPTIEDWLGEFYDTMGLMRDEAAAPTKRALLFMVFALAQQHLCPEPAADAVDMSIRYFLAAQHQLALERGSVRLASVQARLCQCLWLLSQSRINHCWSLFGTAVHLAFAIGLHRHRNADASGGYNYIESECRRRTFWSAYCLDNYLTTALGRPRTFHNEDIDQELPSCCEDEDLFADHITPRIGRGLTLMHAPVAYFKLSRILSMIIRDLYSIRPASYTERHAFAAEYTKSLRNWRAEMRGFLDTDTSLAPIVPIFQRQKNVLNLAYWHTMIMTHRSFLLSNFAGQGSVRGRDDPHKSQTEESIRQCLQSAVQIVTIVDEMCQTGQMYRAYWFTLYLAFSAAVILYVYTIQQSKAAPECYSAYLAAAARCQDQLGSMAEKGSLAARYCLVLEELRIEALKKTERVRTPMPPGGTEPLNNGVLDSSELFSTSNGSMMPNPANFHFSDMTGVVDLANFYASPNSSLAEITSWNQFDSMVFPGLGGFENFAVSDDMPPP
ncbi:fungal-specific transcription factor domain-containing protein [Xylariaceae sp. FL0662B]|nr:fungal-specific transcription factor domain-containing protein [Xylariaceae sp. FL0662B]